VAIPAQPLQIRQDIVPAIPIDVMHHQDTRITYTTIRANWHYSGPFYDISIRILASFPIRMLVSAQEMAILPYSKARLRTEEIPTLRMFEVLICAIHVLATGDAFHE